MVAVTFDYFKGNIERFGMLTPLQEAVANRENGKTTADLLNVAREIRWWRELTSRYVKNSLWAGGWSFLTCGSFIREAHLYNVIAAAAGALFLFGIRRRGRPAPPTRLHFRSDRFITRRPETLVLLILLGLFSVAGLMYHMLHSRLAHGMVATNPWYAAVAFPWLIVLFCQGAALLPGRLLGWIVVFDMAWVYVAAEIHGTLGVMVPAYTGYAWGDAARSRLDALHPAFLGTQWTIPALCLTAILLFLAVLTCLIRHRSDVSHDGPIAGQETSNASQR
jgi:hypothetical protein